MPCTSVARPLVEGIDRLPDAFREQIKGLDGGELHGRRQLDHPLPAAEDRGGLPPCPSDVRLILHNVTGAGGLDPLRSDGVDLVVGSMLDVPADLDYALVYRFEPMLIAPRGHPLATQPDLKLEDLSPYGLILPPQRLTTYRLVDPVPAEPRALHRRPRSRRLGSDQAVRHDGPGHQYRHRHLPHRRRPRSPRHPLARQVPPVTQLRRGARASTCPSRRATSSN